MNEDQHKVSGETIAPDTTEQQNKGDTPISDWQRRHEAAEREREEIRDRVRATKSGRGVIRPAKPKPTISDKGEKSVGIYARVSTKSTEQTSSIENQTLYYTQRVAKEPQWTLHEIYSDEGKSGTSTKKREAFNRMVEAASKKEIDLVLCASVSRFARNMSDCMDYIRKLKTMNPSHPVGVYFETENIYTLDPDSNKQLGVHAMLAEWESANKSARMILSYDQRICTGQYPVSDLLGYRHTKDGQLIIHPEEAKTVRFIYLAYICGYELKEIADILTEKGRPTLKGNTTWNSSMVANIMTNERRWGDLEARKTIVVDFVEHTSKKNEDDRVSAYEEGHHEGIVTPEIARAAKMMALSSRRMQGGVSDFMVIPSGGLKGFVSINPQWGGVNHSTFLQMSSDVYTDEELAEVEKEIHIWSGEEHSKILSMDFTGYTVPRGIYFLTRNMASMTITKKGLKFSKACFSKLGNCQYIEMLYHPILQAIVIRASDAETPNSIGWLKENGSFIPTVTTKAFSQAIYDNMRWRDDLGFQFRGILKERGDQKLLVFALDEPRIIPNSKAKTDKTVIAEDEAKGIKYVPYRIDDTEQDIVEDKMIRRYPAEWEGFYGMGYAVAKRRHKVFDDLTQEDIAVSGIPMINPLIGVIPSRDELEDEVQELLMCM